MESNKDEAQKCFDIAKVKLAQDDLAGSRKWILKSIALFETPAAKTFLSSLDSQPSTSATGASSTSSARAKAPSAAGLNQRSNSTPATSSSEAPAKRDHTPEQRAVVKRVRSCKVTAYYDILEVSSTCEEVEIKKAYRKLALALHPDKNGAPGADEAFKMVSKAFQILSDSQKRAMYDRDGSDPDSRSPATSGFSGFSQNRRGGGPGFQGEVSPEDLFNMFFGGGGAQFGGGAPIFTASFGGPGGGFRTHTTTNARARQPNANTADANTSSFTQILPLLILLGFSLLSSLPSLFSSTPISDPGFNFTPSPPLVDVRQTGSNGVIYYVDKAEWDRHPSLGSAADSVSAKKKFDRTVEHTWAQYVSRICEHKKSDKDRRIQKEAGFFGIGADYDKIRTIQREVIPECEELHRLGYRST